MNKPLTLLAAAALLATGTADAKTKQKPVKGVANAGVLILYSETNFNGDRYEFEKPRVQVPMEWNIRSIAVAPGESWELCEKPRYKAPCTTVDKSVADSSQIGIMGMIGSLRASAKAK